MAGEVIGVPAKDSVLLAMVRLVPPASRPTTRTAPNRPDQLAARSRLPGMRQPSREQEPGHGNPPPRKLGRTYSRSYRAAGSRRQEADRLRPRLSTRNLSIILPALTCGKHYRTITKTLTGQGGRPGAGSRRADTKYIDGRRRSQRYRW